MLEFATNIAVIALWNAHLRFSRSLNWCIGLL